jgi:RNA polymerase sigma-70 factor (ECF subfamily)
MQPRQACDPSDDLELMRGIEARDPRAMETLFDRHASRVLAVCLRVAQNRSDAEDALETVFFELWQRPDRFDPSRGSPHAYLELLARSRSLDLVRARTRAEQRAQVAHDEEEPAREAGRGDPLPLHDVLDRERRMTVRRAIDSLNAGQREVIELAFYQDMTHAEVAERLDLPLGTVKSRIRAGLLLLRRLLASRSFDLGGCA